MPPTHRRRVATDEYHPAGICGDLDAQNLSGPLLRDDGDSNPAVWRLPGRYGDTRDPWVEG